MAKEKAPEFHLDILGQEIRVDNYVVASLKSMYGSTLHVARIIKLTPKKVNLVGLKNKREWSTWAHETVKLSGEDVLAFILKYE